MHTLFHDQEDDGKSCCVLWCTCGRVKYDAKHNATKPIIERKTMIWTNTNVSIREQLFSLKCYEIVGVRDACFRWECLPGVDEIDCIKGIFNSYDW